MRLEAIFNVFSRRHVTKPTAAKPLTPEFRNRALMLCRDTFSPNESNHYTDTLGSFWLEIHQKLQYVHGRPHLSATNVTDQIEDAHLFLQKCDDEHFFDFLELIFKADCLWAASIDEDRLVQDYNLLLEADDLPYALTGFVREKGTSYLFGQERENIQTTSWPRVILRENQAEYAEMIRPTLTLLAEPNYAGANLEFLDAITDYRKGDYGDCLVKCGSAFESVMKLICDRKKWPYKQTDTASALLDTILPRTNLDTFFSQPIMLIATMRNRLGSAHGAGSQPKAPPKHFARYAINATASAILLLVDETS